MAAQRRTLADIKNKKLLRTSGLINAEWTIPKSSTSTFDVIDPANLEKLATLPEMNKTDTALAIDAASDAFKSYKQTSPRHRARLLRKWSDLCHTNADDLSLILTLGNGKTLTESKGEVMYAASFLEGFSTQAETTHGEVVPSSTNPNQRIVTFKQPVGVVGALVSWNFPAAMITRKVGAAIAAGCTTVWKPAGETPLTGLALAVLAEEAGFEKGVVNVITSLETVAEVGEEMCRSAKVKKISSTGSTRVGKLLMKQCADSLKKLGLELDAAILAKFRNSGQTCVTANRIFVQAGVHDTFAEKLADRIKGLKVGGGTEEGVFVGPLTHERAVEKAVRHIEDAKSRGGKVLVGGGQAKGLGSGYFLQPTSLTGMTEKMITTREETFAPVMGLYRFETEEEVIERANDCDVGLGCFIMTESQSRSWRVAEALEVGMVGVNLGMLSACESPFGGVKGSGFGREGATQGIDEYLITKAMLINVATKKYSIPSMSELR